MLILNEFYYQVYLYGYFDSNGDPDKSIALHRLVRFFAIETNDKSLLMCSRR